MSLRLEHVRDTREEDMGETLELSRTYSHQGTFSGRWHGSYPSGHLPRIATDHRGTPLVVPIHSIRYTPWDYDAYRRVTHATQYISNYMLSRALIMVRRDVVTVGYYVLFALLDAGYSEILVYQVDDSLPDDGTAYHTRHPDEFHEDDAT